VPVHFVKDYTSIIFHQQDLGTIQASLEKKLFLSPDAWIAAVRTVFRNSLIYNSSQDDDDTSCMVLLAARSASAVFEKEMMRLRGITAIVSKIQAAKRAAGEKDKGKGPEL
jgi:hypothetical protein